MLVVMTAKLGVRMVRAQVLVGDGESLGGQVESLIRHGLTVDTRLGIRRPGCGIAPRTLGEFYAWAMDLVTTQGPRPPVPVTPLFAAAREAAANNPPVGGWSMAMQPAQQHPVAASAAQAVEFCQAVNQEPEVLYAVSRPVIPEPEPGEELWYPMTGGVLPNNFDLLDASGGNWWLAVVRAPDGKIVKVQIRAATNNVVDLLEGMDPDDIDVEQAIADGVLTASAPTMLRLLKVLVKNRHTTKRAESTLADEACDEANRLFKHMRGGS